MKFSEKLRSIRQAADMTQTDLAEKLNVSRQAVSRWEMGSAMPDVDNLIAMSDLFGVTLDDLLKNKDEAPIPSEKAEVRYWDCLPKRWWILPGAAVGLRLLTFLMELLFILFPRASNTMAADGNTPLVFISMLFSIPGLILISTILLALSACCLLWALVKWLKAKRS